MEKRTAKLDEGSLVKRFFAEIQVRDNDILNYGDGLERVRAEIPLSRKSKLKPGDLIMEERRRNRGHVLCTGFSGQVVEHL